MENIFLKNNALLGSLLLHTDYENGILLVSTFKNLFENFQIQKRMPLTSLLEHFCV